MQWCCAAHKRKKKTSVWVELPSELRTKQKFLMSSLFRSVSEWMKSKPKAEVQLQEPQQEVPVVQSPPADPKEVSSKSQCVPSFYCVHGLGGCDKCQLLHWLDPTSF